VRTERNARRQRCIAQALAQRAGRRADRGRLAGILVCAFTLCAVGGALAASTSTLVPPNGKAGGATYAQWLARDWQTLLKLPRGASACQRVGKVELLIGSPQPAAYTCTVAAGEAVYVNVASTECSTVEKPPYHGSSSAQLKACARSNWKRLTSRGSITESIDGHSVTGLSGFVKASPVYAFHLPPSNVLGSGKLSGQSAAYGVGLVLDGLTAGTHILSGKSSVGGLTYHIVVTG
jgi:hypothetical protein